MPIRRIFWESDKHFDIHMLRGQSHPELTVGHLRFEKIDGTIQWARDYLFDPANAGDVRLEFKPLFIGARPPGSNTYSGHGIIVDVTNGEVWIDAAVPPIKKNNFILEVEALNTADGKMFSSAIRFHIHTSVTEAWLTPSRLRVRSFDPTRAERTPYRFSVRAQFDDGTLADLTHNHDITWGPVSHVVHIGGRLIINAGETPGDEFVITATLPPFMGGGSATGKMAIIKSWADEDQTTAFIVPGRRPTGFVNPERVPNFLILGDGFRVDDEARFDTLVNSIVHHIRTSRLTRPFDILSTSMNFWKAFVPSFERSISVRCEVFPAEKDGKNVAYAIPNPEKPPVDGNWSLEHLIYAVGLPVPEDEPGNAARLNQSIRNEWTQLVNPDPSPHVSDGLLASWRRMAKRTFIEEQDSALGQAYGTPPTVSMESDNRSTGFHPGRPDRDQLNRFLETLEDEHGNNISSLWNDWGDGAGFVLLNVASTAGDATVSMDGFTASTGTLRKGARFTIGTTSTIYVVTEDTPIAANAAANIPIAPVLSSSESDNAQIGGTRPTNFDYVFIISSSKWDRGINYFGYISMNVEDRQWFEEVETIAGKNALRWQQPAPFISTISGSISRIRSGRAIHEIAHSFGLGDEYAEKTDPFSGNAASLKKYGNLQDLQDAQRGGNLHGDEIKWNWHRIRKAGVINGTITSQGGNSWRVPLINGHGTRFAAGDTILIRKRDYPNPLQKNPVVSNPFTALEPMTANFITIQGTITPDDDWVSDDIVYMPVPAPESVRSADYPYAEIVAKNIKVHITRNQVPLTPDPCVEDKRQTQDPKLDGVDLPFCFKSKPKIVGLYAGGRLHHCGIFHPAGHCMMRGGDFDEQEFCFVCRYLIVDIIDPTKHSIIDDDYEKVYPQK